MLGGGAARGALRVGVLHALCEGGPRPALIVGTSARAIHAASVMACAHASSLPIGPVLCAGVTDAVALDVTDSRDMFGQVNGFGVLLNRLTYAVERRHIDPELELAQARDVPVLYLNVIGKQPGPVSDFWHSDELSAQDYEVAGRAIDRFPIVEPERAST